LALKDWRPRTAQGRGAIFGAAGSRGFEVDREMSSLIPSSLWAGATEPMNRLFSTEIGKRAASAVGNETRTLAALQRLSVEIMAQSLRITGQAGEGDRLLVVPGQQGRPPILMLMSPNVLSVDESRIISNDLDLPFPILMKGLSEAADPKESTPEAAALREVLQGGKEALAEVFLISQPEIVLTRRPRMIPLCVPSPHMRLQCGSRISTAGMFCRDADGDLGVTGCYHGTGPVGTEVTVYLQKSRVKHASEVQDLVFIPLGEEFGMPQTVGLGGVREDREPAKADHVRFDGVINQNRTTRIFGSDNGLLRARPTVQLKVQTDPDTDQGDSGSALLDEHDSVLGFAFERTDYDDYPQFTDWIWAANALRALQLVPYK
jgi:hypothetical protein